MIGTISTLTSLVGRSLRDNGLGWNLNECTLRFRADDSSLSHSEHFHSESDSMSELELVVDCSEHFRLRIDDFPEHAGDCNPGLEVLERVGDLEIGDLGVEDVEIEEDLS